MNNIKNKGFTLIELVVVIVILGILSVVALPKFINLTDDSRKAVMEGLAASIKSTVTMVHAKALIHKKLVGTDVVEGDGLYFSIVNSYPNSHQMGDGSGDSAVNATSIIGALDKTIPLIQVQLTVNGVRSTTFSYSNLGDGCQVIYKEALSADEPPIVETNYTDC